MSENKFGKLRLSAKGTTNGSGFDIFYDFGKVLDFVEFTSKPEFFFIQPWMQFPSREYSDTCKLVSIELVRRFNGFEELERVIERDAKDAKRMQEELAAIIKEYASHDACNGDNNNHAEACLWCKAKRTIERLGYAINK